MPIVARHGGKTEQVLGLRGTEFAALVGMPNPQLDQFMQAMTWKILYVVILGSIGGAARMSALNSGAALDIRVVGERG